jgi:penicillin-binding protein 2
MSPNPFEIYRETDARKKHANLEWEESALDEHSSVEGFAHGEVEPLSHSVPWWLRFVIGIAAVIVLIKLFTLQVIEGRQYRVMAEGNRLRVQTILAPRGQITDRTGSVLARNTASFSLVATPVDLPKTNNLDEQLKAVAQLLKVNENELREKLKNYNPSSFQPIILKHDLTQQDSILFETRAHEFPGFSVHSIPIREYPNPLVFSHVLGYSGIISEKELAQLGDKGYEPNDFIGKSGIELSYENYLKGINGAKQVEVDASGRPVKILGNLDPQPGSVVQLNINQGLQEQLYQGFTKRSSRAKGAAVALNPKTGEVLALLSLPGYDNNLFAPGISQTDYDKLTNDPLLPLFNRAITGTYPPGSTVKPMTGLAALELGVVTDETIIVDRGVLVIPNQYNPRINYNFYGWKRDGLGPMNVRSAIAQSSDIYFYAVAGGHPSMDIEGMGIQALADYYRKFNTGRVTGIDLQGEKPGVVPDPAWKASYHKNDPVLSRWYLGDTYHVAIGQGDMLTTPLQVALWTAVVANDGVGMKPVVLKQVLDQQGKVIHKSEPQVLIEKFASNENLQIVQNGMRETILYGSGVQLNTLPVTSAGKTGTSQFDGSDPSRTHAWFTAYAPFEDPKIVITVLVEAGGEGHAAAVPIVKEALDWCIKNDCFNK